MLLTERGPVRNSSTIREPVGLGESGERIAS